MNESGRKYEKAMVVDEMIVAWRVDRALSHHLEGWSRSGVGDLIRSGGVKVNGEIVGKGSLRLSMGDEIFVDRDALNKIMKSREFARTVENFTDTGEISVVTPENIPIDIVYEDEDILVVDKPAGMVVHPAYANTSGTLVNAVAGYFKAQGIEFIRRIGLVHRLDKDVSGLVMFAKNEQTLRALSDQFSSEGIVPGGGEPPMKAQKFYWAVVGPVTEEDLRKIGLRVGKGQKHVDGFIRRSRGDRRKSVFREGYEPSRYEKERYALSYVCAERKLEEGYFMLEIRIVTGRTHQIRAQLAAIGLPIVGDVLYGGEKTVDLKGIRLRCVRLSFIPPKVYSESSIFHEKEDKRGQSNEEVKGFLDVRGKKGEKHEENMVTVEKLIVP